MFNNNYKLLHMRSVNDHKREKLGCIVDIV